MTMESRLTTMKPGFGARRKLAVLVLASVLASAAAVVESAARQVPQPASPTRPITPSPMSAGPTVTGAISGIVVDATTNAPVAAALVELSIESTRPGSSGRAMTDAKGRFVFLDLPASDHFAVGVSKLGYLDGGASFGPGTSGGRVSLRDGTWVSDLRVPLSRLGAIGGTVVDERGEPVVDVYVRAIAKVQVLGRDEFAAGAYASTDERGRYRIAALAPGQYLVEVPSVQTSLPAPSQGGTVAPGSRLRALSLDTGERLTIFHAPIPPPPMNGRRFAYPDVFYPGVRDAGSAASISLAAGEQPDGIDVTIAPVPTFRVSGVVAGPDESWTDLRLRLLPEGSEHFGPGVEAATAQVGSGGRFTFFNVPVGTYTLDATRAASGFEIAQPAADVFGSPSSAWLGMGSMSDEIQAATGGLRFVMGMGRSPTYWGRQSLVVDGDVTDVNVTMYPTGHIRGRVTKDLAPNTSVPAEQVPLIHPDPADGSPSLMTPREQWPQRVSNTDFDYGGLLPGEYFLRTRLPWIVESISWNGRNYTDLPLDAGQTPDIRDVEVVVTNVGATLSGTVKSADGAPARDAVVLLFPTASERWTNIGFWSPVVRYLTASTSGQYSMENVPAGDYEVIAVSGPSDAVRVGPEFFRMAAPLASRVSLSWRQTTTVDLTVHERLR